MASWYSEGAMGLGSLFAVVSGKGGTGKTSVCAGIATALAEAGRSVLCVDCDVGLPDGSYLRPEYRETYAKIPYTSMEHLDMETVML